MRTHAEPSSLPPQPRDRPTDAVTRPHGDYEIEAAIVSYKKWAYIVVE